MSTFERNRRSNMLKKAMAENYHDVLYVIYAIFQKKALSSILFKVLKQMNLVEDYKTYKLVLKDLEEEGLIKRTPIKIFDKYNKQEEVVLRQFAIDYMADVLNESPVAVAQSTTNTATLVRTAKALFLSQIRADRIAQKGIEDWKWMLKYSTYFIAPNKTAEWLDWFSGYLHYFEKVPQIAENFANLKAFYAKEQEGAAANLMIGRKSSRNKGLQADASPVLEERVSVKTMVIEDDVQKQTKESLLDNVTLHKILNNNIYLYPVKMEPKTLTGKEKSEFGFYKYWYYYIRT